MYCYKCGSELPDNSAFCMSCGAKLKDLNREQSEGEQKTEVESIQEPMEKEVEQSTPPIEQMRSDVMTAEQASAEIAQLIQVLKQAVKEKQAKKDTKWARIRIDKKARSGIKFLIIMVASCFFFLLLATALFCYVMEDAEVVWMFALFFLFTDLCCGIVAIISNYQLKEMNTSDLYVSNIKCYGIDIHGEMVSFQLNEIFGVKRAKRYSPVNSNGCGFLSLSTIGREYIFASRDIDIVVATFGKYLSEREKKR